MAGQGLNQTMAGQGYSTDREVNYNARNNPSSKPNNNTSMTLNPDKQDPASDSRNRYQGIRLISQTTTARTRDPPSRYFEEQHSVPNSTKGAPYPGKAVGGVRGYDSLREKKIIEKYPPM